MEYLLFDGPECRGINARVVWSSLANSIADLLIREVEGPTV